MTQLPVYRLCRVCAAVAVLFSARTLIAADNTPLTTCTSLTISREDRRCVGCVQLLVDNGERIGQGARRQGSERARERKFQGAKVPGSELARVLLADSLRGANWPGSEKARYQLYRQRLRLRSSRHRARKLHGYRQRETAVRYKKIGCRTVTSPSDRSGTHDDHPALR